MVGQLLYISTNHTNLKNLQSNVILCTGNSIQ